MPGLDGIGVARALAERRPSPAIILHHRVRSVRGGCVRVEASISDEAGEPAGSSGRSAAGVIISSGARRDRTSGPSCRLHLQEFWASDLTGLVRIAARDIDRVSAER